VRIGFQRRPWDILLCVSYSILVSVGLFVLGVGDIFALAFVLFVPGYLLVAAMFPSKREIDWTERIALDIGVSLAVVPFLGLALNFTSLGIRFTAIIGTIVLFTLMLGAAAWWRRMQLSAEERLSAAINITLPRWGENSLVDRILTVSLLVSIVVAAGTVVYFVSTPRPPERFTEFYILGPGGNASGYPTNLAVNETGSVIMGIANHEAARVNYTVRIDLVGVQIVYNATSGYNETAEFNRTTWSTFNLTLADGLNWTQSYTFRISDTGLWNVKFFLFKDGDLSSTYRELHLFVRVA